MAPRAASVRLWQPPITVLLVRFCCCLAGLPGAAGAAAAAAVLAGADGAVAAAVRGSAQARQASPPPLAARQPLDEDGDDDAPLCLVQRDVARFAAIVADSAGRHADVGKAASPPKETAQVAALSARSDAAAVAGVHGAETDEGPSFQSSNTSPEATEILHAASPTTINLVVCGLLAFIAAVTGLGRYLGGKRAGALAMVAASYIVLLPGLFAKDFSLNVAVLFSLLPGIPPLRIQVTQPHHKPGPVRESTRSMVPFLWDNDCKQGALLVALFAFVVPLAKLALLVHAERQRASADPQKVLSARRSIQAVQIVSKWASPDMFFLIIIYSLVRALGKPPFLESLQVLDVGFSCYAIFCVASVVSTLAIDLPRYPDALRGGADGGGGETGAGVSAAADKQGVLLQFARRLGPAGRRGVSALLAVSWATLFWRGIMEACFTMRIDIAALKKTQHISDAIVTMVRGMGLEDLAEADVNIWHSAEKPLVWFFDSGELNLLLAAVMLGGFVIVLTAVSMALLTLIGVARLGSPSKAADTRGADETLGAALGTRPAMAPALRAAHVLRHLCMLDVCAAGMFLFSFAAASWEENGVFIDRRRGIYMALASEAVHHFAFYFAFAAEAAAATDSDEPP